MHEITAKIGEAKPHKLATLAVRTGYVPLNGDKELSVIRRAGIALARDVQK